MPFYEYRPKSGECAVCDGCFVDLQKMSDPAHSKCPDCGQACKRVLSAPIVSVRGSEYRAAANKEMRQASMARAIGENDRLRASTLNRNGNIDGHTHNCALAGCFGDDARIDAATSESDQADQNEKAHRFGGLPHLVGVDKKKNLG